MPDQNALRRTALHSSHTALGATMAGFGGWDMPLWYKAGAVKEHLAVIQTAGIFDTSHMDVILVSGASAQTFLNYAFTRDIRAARPNRAIYGAFLTSQGHCLDDGVLYPFANGDYGIVVNAGMGPGICAHLRSLPGAENLSIAELPDRQGKIDIQGPDALVLTASLFDQATAKTLFAPFPYFSFQGDFIFAKSDVRLADGTPVLLSRSGYTGELGFELFAPQNAIATVWQTLLDRGAVPCGLAARDSLRAGAVLPLSHQDIGPWPFINHPWEIALPLTPEKTFSKLFVGSDALDTTAALHTLPFAGFDQRRVDAHSAKVFLETSEIGSVTTIVSDMAIGRVDGNIVGLASPERPDGWQPRGLACGFVRVDRPLVCGTKILLRDARREIPVEIVADIRPDRTARKKLPPLS